MENGRIAKIRSVVSSLRRVRTRVPFWQLTAHRIPTLWSLYRGLLRTAPTELIRQRIRELFKHDKQLTGTAATQKQLLKGYKWLDIFTRAQKDQHFYSVLQRYHKLLEVKQDKKYWKSLYRKEQEWRIRLLNRPILTGSFLRPTLYNRPLPRMKPQPLCITMMIKKRRVARDRRMRKLALMQEWVDDLRREAEFERMLKKHANVQFTEVFNDSLREWVGRLMTIQRRIFMTFNLELERANAPLSPLLVETVKQARREKIANKTRERERERCGEILRSTIKRRNQGPPAHVLRSMTKEQRAMDRIVRSVSEVGYVGVIKRKLGFQLKDPHAWKQELHSGEDKARIDRMVQSIAIQNQGRRQLVSD